MSNLEYWLNFSLLILYTYKKKKNWDFIFYILLFDHEQIINQRFIINNISFIKHNTKLGKKKIFILLSFYPTCNKILWISYESKWKSFGFLFFFFFLFYNLDKDFFFPFIFFTNNLLLSFFNFYFKIEI